MSILRKAELSLMSFLYSNRSVRLAKRRTEIIKRVSLSCALAFLLFQWEYKLDRMIKSSEEIAKPQSFMIDGPDPFCMSE
jgi:hypothetical protein